MIRSFSELVTKVRALEPETIAVAAAQDKDVMMSLENVRRMGIGNSILVGDRREIEKISAEIGADLKNYEVVDIKDKEEACRIAVDLVSQGKASMLMKGFVDTPIILKAVLNERSSLRTGNLLSHVGLLEVKGFEQMFLLSDSAMTIKPSLENKVDIIKNAVRVAHALGIDMPKVAVLCAVENVNPKMPATLDAEKLTQMNEAGEIKGCIVKGPLALDNAVSLEAARHKGIDHPVAGRADILIAPDIESGNILNKSMEYFAKAEKAGVIMGAKSPIILTSRASSERAKLHSIALAILIAAEEGKSNAKAI